MEMPATLDLGDPSTFSGGPPPIPGGPGVVPSRLLMQQLHDAGESLQGALEGGCAGGGAVRDIGGTGGTGGCRRAC